MSGSTHGTEWSFRLFGSPWRGMAAAGALVLTGAVLAAPPPPASAKPRPELSFQASSVHFSVPADLPADVAPQVTVTMLNSGQTATSAIKVTVPDESPFQVVDETCPRSLGPRKTCTVTVQFTPTGAPAAAATLTASATRTTAVLALLGVTGTVRDDSLPGDFGFPCDWTQPGLEDTVKCIVGTGGDDYTYGSVLSDQQWGLAGDDDLHGSSGDDWIYGDGVYSDPGYPGSDTIHGNLGHDHLFGRGHSDTLYGGDGDDRLHGEAGTDKMYGGDGDDILEDWVSKGDNDTYSGGNGHDLCQIASGDVVLDCEEVHLAM